MRIFKKQAGKDFVILNITDPQLSAEEWATQTKHRKILEYTITQLIEKVQPDLITVSGDLAWAGQDAAYDAFASFLNAFQIPWAPVWGNHDNQNGPEFIDGVVARYITYSHCVYEKGDEAFGNGNYVISIEENGVPVSALVMMDSHDRLPYTNEKGETQMAWAKLLPEQGVWYAEQVKALQAQGCKDVTALLHIPIYAYHEAAEAVFKTAGTPAESEAYVEGVGYQYEGVSCYPEEDGMFDVFKQTQITKRVLVGHDHVNNWMIQWRGIQLIYALKAGAGCYWNPQLNGGTVLKINEGGVYEVYHQYVNVSQF